MNVRENEKMTPPSALGAEAGLTRRQFVGRSGAIGAGVGMAGLLAACGGSGNSDASPSGASTTAQASSSKMANGYASNSAVTGTPSPGGTLRVGVIGNGSGESYNPGTAAAEVDYLHVNAVYDSLYREGNFNRQLPGLALSFEPNKDVTVWEIKLRQGVTWHDGKPFTADDVIYSMRAMGQPSNLGNPNVANVRLADLKKLGPNTVQVPLKTPDAGWPTFMCIIQSAIIQDGTKNFDKPVGTGPYKLQSFTPGQRSVLTANKDYWDHPRPYPDQLEIISINDDSARLNALLAHDIDICSPLTTAQAKANVNNPDGEFVVLVGYPTWFETINMRVDVAPFNDVRVRQALKLIANRPQLVEIALDGFGVVGNDVLANGSLEFFNPHLAQREQDIEQAKSLLKSAGQGDLRVVLNTTNMQSVTIPAAEVYARQAAAANVSISVRQRTQAAYFNPSELFAKMPLAQDYWGVISLEQFWGSALIPGAVYNETHWTDPTTESLYHQALATTDRAKAQVVWNQLQEIQYNSGGYVVWGRQQTTDAAAPNVRGLGEPGWGGVNLADTWNWGLA